MTETSMCLRRKSLPSSLRRGREVSTRRKMFSFGPAQLLCCIGRQNDACYYPEIDDFPDLLHRVAEELTIVRLTRQPFAVKMGRLGPIQRHSPPLLRFLLVEALPAGLGQKQTVLIEPRYSC